MTDESEHKTAKTSTDAATRARAEELHTHTNPTTTTRDKHFDGSYQSMLFGSAGTLEKPAWSDSTKGRLAIRMFSRGILGAAMFTIGGRISRVQLLDYDPHTFEWSMAKEKPLQAIAKGFDEVFGKPIGKIARMRVNTKGLTEAEAKLAKANAEWDATMFRTASYYHTSSGKLDHKGRPMNGRSLGAEIVAVSFDFAMMSVGDASGRNFVQMIDPNIRKTWMVNDKGEKAKQGEKAHFSGTKFVQSLGRSAWRIISKNQGEDWAVALPYVYQMRFQRKMLSKLFAEEEKGVKIVFDHAWNGAAYKVNNQGKIVGDYQLAGAIDLHGRFVGYNVLTLMFREGYDTISNHYKQWKENGYGMHLHMPKHIDPIGAATNAVRYGVKSFIKANLYMNPAVVPFWLMRVPQTKWRGALIHSELEGSMNAIATESSLSSRIAKKAAAIGMAPEEFKKITVIERKGADPIYNFSSAKDRITGGMANQPKTMFFDDLEVKNPLHALKGPNDPKQYEHFESGFQKTFSQAVNPFGQFCYWLGGKTANLAHELPEGKVKNFIGLPDKLLIAHKNGDKSLPLVGTKAGRETFARNFIDASMAYTPYFFAKSEFGLRVDDTPSTGGRGKMDNAIYGLIDNVCALNPHKTGASMKEIWNLSVHRDKVIMREGSANNPEKPKTVIHAEGIAAPEKLAPTTTPAKEGSDKKWAESVVGKNLAAQFQSSNTQTRH